MKCRHCAVQLGYSFLDLGFAPPSNAYLKPPHLARPEKYFPLRILICQNCWLVQTEDFAEASDLFDSEYAYFSSASKSWLNHAKLFCDQSIEQFKLDQNSFVVEVASNDGYLLKNYVRKGIPCLGIEPTRSTAEAAMSLGVPVLQKFFGEKTATDLASAGQKADLIVGNNVFAHVPDINDFARGLKILLAPAGCITLEFPHIVKLLQNAQFDTVYHEHFSYLSLSVAVRIFEAAGLRIWDVEEISTHGGSLRIFGCHKNDPRKETSRYKFLLVSEQEFGLQTIEVYRNFQSRVELIKDQFLEFLLNQKQKEKIVVGYGAAAKGNTLLNFSGIKKDLLPFICDAAKSKQGKFTPGSHIPILSPEILRDIKIDYLIIFPWNIAEEVKDQYQFLRKKGVKFVTAIPELRIT